jgi:hypothetical protein
MKRGGVGGANTLSGISYESKTSLAAALARVPDLRVSDDEVLRGGRRIAQIFRKFELYSNILQPRGVDWKEIISTRLLPDDGLLVEAARRVTIFEVKYQEGAGSVDEKLQTCHFKLQQYSKLFAPLGHEVRYCYVLNDWFRQPRYRDVLDYITSVGCHYFFEVVPRDYLGI